ncbi:hypothetical protein MMC25_007345 [Agyrium rufum]|nr:hypothetical protein [Agyrium rufum]
MPHTSRKGRKTPQKKRVNVEDAEGWTHVRRGSPRETQEAEDKRYQSSLPNPVDNRESEEETHDQDHDATSKRSKSNNLSLSSLQKRCSNLAEKGWNNTSTHDALVKIFDEMMSKSEKLELDQVVCLGLGSMADDDNHANSNTACVQFAAFETIISLLRKNFNIKRVLVQDPKFLPVDEVFIQEKGFEVFRDPQAIEEMTTRTFLYAPCCYWPIIGRALDVAVPSLYIGNDVKEYLDDMTTKDGDDWSGAVLESAKRVVDKYRIRRLPPVDDMKLIRLGSVHIRKQDGEEHSEEV